MKTMATLLLLAVALSGPPLTRAEGGPDFGMGGPPPGDPGSEPGMMLPLLLGGVDLTSEQRSRVRTILESHHPAFRELFGQLRAARESMEDRLLGPGAIGPDDLHGDVQRILGLKERLMQEGLKVAFEVRTVLTPEQLAKAARVRTRLGELRTEMRSLLGDPVGFRLR